jgi:hypothetical protein
MTTTPDVLLAEAQRLLESRAADLRGTWPRAVALLTRQAVEQTLDDLWRWKAPGTERASRRAQLLCLGSYIGDEALAQEVRYAWAALSRACHHQPYEVGGTAEDLRMSRDVVARLRDSIGELTNE